MFLFETLQKKKQKPDLFRKDLLLFGGFLHDAKIFIFTESIFNLRLIFNLMCTCAGFITVLMEVVHFLL